MEKKYYSRKTVGGGRSTQSIYVWSPVTNTAKTNLGSDSLLTGCDNKKNVDYDVDYTYEIVLVNNIATHVPYVQCGYVE